MPEDTINDKQFTYYATQHPRANQRSIAPLASKQRNIDGLIIFQGIASLRPPNIPVITDVKAYWATDTEVLSLWDGTAWIDIEGTVGATGIKGDTGSQGTTGVKGNTGIPGTAAAQGDTGVTGSTGVQGNTGPKGDTGIAGAAAAQGNTGVKGDTGAKGDTGVIPAFIVTTTAISYAILTTDNIIKATAHTITITLPTAVGVAGKVYTIDNASSGSITVDTTGGQTIEDQSTQTILTQSAMDVYSDGANWRII